MDIGGCRLLDGDGDGGGLVADLHVHLGGAGLDAVDGAGAGDRHGGPVTPPDSVGRDGVLGADHVELGEVAFLDGQFAVRDALAGDADGGVVRDRAVLVHLAGGPGDAERLGLVGLGLAVLGRVPRGLAVGVDLDQTECDGVALADLRGAGVRVAVPGELDAAGAGPGLALALAPVADRVQGKVLVSAPPVRRKQNRTYTFPSE